MHFWSIRRIHYSWLQMHHLPGDFLNCFFFLLFLHMRRFFFQNYHFCFFKFHFLLLSLLHVLILFAFAYLVNITFSHLLQASPTHFLTTVDTIYQNNTHKTHSHGIPHFLIVVDTCFIKTFILTVALGDKCRFVFISIYT